MSDKRTINLPEKWVVQSIGEIATISTGKKDANHATEDGKYKFYTCAFKPLMSPTFSFEDEAIILPGNGHNVGEVFYFEGMFEAYQRTYVLHKIKVDPKYLFYQLKLGWKKATAEKQYGSATNYIRIGNFTDYSLPIAPPEQQKQIVAKIEQLFSHIDAGIEGLNTAKQRLKQYRQSVLKAAVTGELTKEWREENKDKLEPASQLLERILQIRRQKWEEQQLEQFKAKGNTPKNDKWKEKYKEPVQAKKWRFLSVLPDSWYWVSVDQIGDSQDQPVLTGPFGSNLGKNDFIEQGIPLLTIGCLKEAGIDLSKAKYISEKKAEELNRYKLKDGDLLFSRMAAVGRVGFVTRELKGALFNYHIMRLRLHPLAMMQEYFVAYVRGSSQVYDYVKEVNHGATRDGINTQQLLEMPVALASFDEQKEVCRIVEGKLDAIRFLEMDIEKQLIKAKKSKQSILASAFSGKLI